MTFNDIEYWKNVPLSFFTSLQIGGCADYLMRVRTTKQLVILLEKLRINQIPFYILGAGQNVLVSDAGAIFRTIEDHPVAKLIEEVGLKGHKIGDAMISPQHSAWFVNFGKATANDFVSLMQLTATRVFESYGIRLHPTVKYVGELTSNVVDLFG